MAVQHQASPSPADQERIYKVIANALLQDLPEGWEKLTLEIGVSEGGHIRCSAHGPSGTPDLRIYDDSLYAAACELYDLFASLGTPFTKCVISLGWQAENELWKYRADYTYRA